MVMLLQIGSETEFLLQLPAEFRQIVGAEGLDVVAGGANHVVVPVVLVRQFKMEFVSDDYLGHHAQSLQ